MTVMTPMRVEAGLGMTSQRARDRLAERLKAEGIQNPRVLQAIKQVPRHTFVDEGFQTRAYEDTALPIGLGQTISQPFIVARMTEALLQYAPTLHRVLEIGTGSGYQAAILSAVVPEVFTVERILKLLTKARLRLRGLGIQNVRAKHADGCLGWPEEGPFDAIMLTAAGEFIPPVLFEQLSAQGILLAPVGEPNHQQLICARRTEQGIVQESLCAVSFVPLLGGLL